MESLMVCMCACPTDVLHCTTPSSLPAQYLANNPIARTMGLMFYGPLQGYDKKIRQERKQGTGSVARWRRRTVNHLFVYCIRDMLLSDCVK